MIGLLASIRQASVETRIISMSLLAKAFKILAASTEILVDPVAICQIKSQRTEDLLQRQSRE
jgi:hypothetical protein